MAKEGTIPYPERDIMRAQDLLNRWIGATEEEIVIHNQKGELQAFKRHKGPIKGIIWCNPFSLKYYKETGKIWELPDYFLIADILACEKANPEYTGSINPDAYLGNEDHAQGVDLIPQHDGLTTFSAYEVGNMLGLVPMELVDALNGQNVYDNNGILVGTRRLVTTDEEAFRNYTFNEPYFNSDSLRNVTIYKKDFLNFCKEWNYETNVTLDNKTLEQLEHEIKVLKFQKKLLKDDYEKQIAEQAQRYEALQAEYQDLQARFSELQQAASKMDADPDNDNLNERQRGTLNAAGELLIEIGKGEKFDYKSNEFHKALSSRYGYYLTEIERWAWRLLPDRFKHGAGRPKNNPENPEK